ncbi:MAG TPA: type II CAAX endopeptidase family protein [Chitinispirillaceae bacterium]|nr:type II CAAX endopeptidase family protein [Chitinispirillaceae bacterium]
MLQSETNFDPATQREAYVNNGDKPVLIKERTTELFVFLFLIIPSILLSFFFISRGPELFSFIAVQTILRDLGLLFLVLFFIWRNNENFSDIGLYFKEAGLEALIGALLFFPVSLSASVLQQILTHIGIQSPINQTPFIFEREGLYQLVLAIFLVTVVAITEETVFRGYLINRFKVFTNNNSASVFFSTAIFAIGHGYQGTSGIIVVGYLGFIFALVYLWRRSLVAPMIMHFMQNFLGIIINYYLLK